MAPKRDAKGKFLESGNPGGRPKELAEVRELARQHTVDVIARLATIAKTGDEGASVAACKELLNRGWGRVPLAVTGSDGGPISFVYNLGDKK